MQISKLLNSFSGIRRILIFAFSIFLVLLLYIPDVSFLDRFELSTQDIRMQIRGEHTAHQDIVIIYLSNNDIEKLGSWPVKRNYYGRMIDGLIPLQPKAIGFHIFFDPNRKMYSEYDDFFILASRKAENLIMPFYFSDLKTGYDESPLQNISREYNDLKPFGIKNLENVREWITGKDPSVPAKKFLEESVSLGFTNLIPDLDGVIRRSPLLCRYNNDFYPSFSLQLFRRLNSDFQKIEIETSGNIKIGNYNPVTLNPKNSSLLLNYPGSWSKFKTYSFLEVLQNFNFQKSGKPLKIDLKELKDKIILIASSPYGKSSFYTTPFSSNFPEIGIHATILDNLINNNFLHGCPAVVMVFILVILLTALHIFIFSRPDHIGIFQGLMVYFGYLAVSYFLFSFGNIVIDIIKPTIAFFAAGFASVFMKYVEQRGRWYGVQKEKVKIQTVLVEKEKKLSELEYTLKENITLQKSTLEKERLAEDIRRYRDTVNDLKKDLKNAGSKIETGKTPAPHSGYMQNGIDIIYSSGSKLKDSIDLVNKVAGEDVSVLIYGESGTGKELIARLIHKKSRRSNKPFIAVNCGALTETLLESELFGHEKGSFTGAVNSKKGRFELANGGTLFLDEISETSLNFQVKLLRILQEGEFERVGGQQVRKVDVRIITATNRDLKEEIIKGKFREDLFYRLNIFLVNLPPLKERQGDIQALAGYFIKTNTTDNKITISSQALQFLQRHSWPGNIRELENIIKRAIILVKSENRDFIGIEDLPSELQNTAYETILPAASSVNDDFEFKILYSLRKHNFSRGSVSITASELGSINRGTVAEYLRGICLLSFCRNKYNFINAVREIAGTEEETTVNTVAKKISGYLSNAVEFVSFDEPEEAVISKSKGKYKNLPKKFHPMLSKILKDYRSGKWEVPD